MPAYSQGKRSDKKIDDNGPLTGHLHGRLGSQGVD